MIEVIDGHGALFASGHPVFPGFQGDGVSFRIERDGETAATYAVAVLTLGDMTLYDYLEKQSWLGLPHEDELIHLRDGAADLGKQITGAAGFIGGLWVRPDLRRTDFSRWCTVDLPTIAMQECERRWKLDHYFFFVQNGRIGEAAKPDDMAETVLWIRPNEEQTPRRLLGVISRENVLARSVPGSAPR